MAKDTNTQFLNLSEETKEYFQPEALKEAEQKMFEIFSLMFSEARRIAVDRRKSEVKISISRDHWLEGYWSMIGSLRLKKHYPMWYLLGKLALLILPIWIGYAFSDPKEMYGQLITAIVLSAIVFIGVEKLEAK